MLNTKLKSLLLLLLLIASGFFFIPAPSPQRGKARSPRFAGEAGPTSLGGTSQLSSRSIYGIASWYGPYFHGRKTANGEVFNKNDSTAAHKTLPFNTRVLVTNLKNNKSIIVRINDRGPFINGRMIDLSEESATKIGCIKEGLAIVRLEILSTQ